LIYTITEFTKKYIHTLPVDYSSSEEAKIVCEQLYSELIIKWKPYWLTGDCFYAEIKGNNITFLLIDYKYSITTAVPKLSLPITLRIEDI